MTKSSIGRLLLGNVLAGLLIFFDASRAVADSFALTSVVPKVFSPNAGTVNQVVFKFTASNPAQVNIQIFDIRGAAIRRTIGGDPGASTLYWDGRDDNGTIVRAGAYIYQIQYGGLIKTGVVVVAK